MDWLDMLLQLVLPVPVTTIVQRLLGTLYSIAFIKLSDALLPSQIIDVQQVRNYVMSSQCLDGEYQLAAENRGGRYGTIANRYIVNSAQTCRQVSVRRRFSGSSRFSIVEFLHSERSGNASLHHTLPKPAVTVQEDDGESADISSGSLADSGNSTNWTPERGQSPLDSSGSYPRREVART
ncbi:hypothetical protein EVAR_97502_1 [Eumeta japonica]|uniref:Uncharacterized protein n=1 Tax=Eumeta variegata TaxID=151549 RepID=A0A4C1WNF4_EUMVA|nr:hypothetical protein EVAR_97502_1 [Eumeta japonica]